MSEQSYSGQTESRRPGRLPHGFFVDEDTNAPNELDWSSWTLTEEDALPGSFEQSSIILKFRDYLDAWAHDQRWSSIVGIEVFFAWVHQEPNVRVSPDVFICEDRNLPRRGVVNIWERGRLPPRFALEVVSKDRKKDYLHAPERYAALGTRELVIFDPVAADTQTSLYPHALTLYRRFGDGSLRRVYEGRGPVYSEEVGAWLLLSRLNGEPYLRLARDPDGRELVETRADAAEIRAADAERRLRELEARLNAAEKPK